MSRKRKLIPFGWLPMSWGLAGTIRQAREAEYYWDGEELERLLIDINYPDDALERAYLNFDVDLKYEHIDKYTYDIKHAELAYTDPEKLARAKLEIDYTHHRIGSYEYQIKRAETDFTDEAERKIWLLENEHNHQKIDDREYAKQLATLKEEPYITVIRSEYDAREGMDGLTFEFDWNDLWIDYLRLNGYVGLRDEELVEQWFTEVCRNVAEANPEEDTSNVPFNSGRVIRQVRRDGTSSEYS